MTKPNYRVNQSAIPVREVHPQASFSPVKLRAQKCYGTESSLVFAERDPDYHTKPHRHDCEQINYIMSGEIWFYVEDNGYRCRQGDVMRIPRGAVHWAWNRGNGNAVVIESHCPPLIMGEEHRAESISLHGPNEDPASVHYVQNERVTMDENKVREIEERAFREEG